MNNKVISLCLMNIYLYERSILYNKLFYYPAPTLGSVRTKRPEPEYQNKVNTVASK